MTATPDRQAPVLLEVDGLTVRLGGADVVADASFRLPAGGRSGLIGESGSGKSVTALALMGLLPDDAEVEGSIRLRGQELIGLRDADWRRVRGAEVAMVFQEPMSALDPLQRVGDQVAEAVALHHGGSRSGARRRAVELLADVALPEPVVLARRYPHQLSGGQRQRVVLAIALAGDPAVLVADEPTTALDVTVQAEMLALLDRLVRDRDLALLLISHDLAVVASVCTDLTVMQDGRFVEQGVLREVFAQPQHPHTRALLAASDLRPGAAPAPAEPPPADPPVLEVTGLVQRYRGSRTALTRPAPVTTAVDDVDLAVHAGEALGVVGESGAGKSTLVRALLALEDPTAGQVRHHGRPVRAGDRRGLMTLRREVAVVLQDPRGSLNPRMRAHDLVAEPLRALRTGDDEDVRVPELLRAVGLEPELADRYPHQFSGGQRQRLAIARALSTRPRVVIGDEPVSALDVSVRGQILDLLRQVTVDVGASLVLVSHDLSVIRAVCDRVVVMHRGRVVESGPVAEVYEQPRQEYTRTLLGSVPTLDGTLLHRTPGAPPAQGSAT